MSNRNGVRGREKGAKKGKEGTAPAGLAFLVKMHRILPFFLSLLFSCIYSASIY